MIIGWFSCGATSAVACRLALEMYSDVHIYYIETGSSHPDNTRFLKDCERWFDCEINIIRSSKYSSVEDVLLNRRFINSPHGAACTYELKKKVRYNLEKSLQHWDGQVLGFEFSTREINRALRFKEQYPETKPLFPLIDCKMTKTNALGILQKAGIEIPAMYRLGYSNNNCIGCVKGGIGYWNNIRVDFPEVFVRMANIERQINATCLKGEAGKIFLDELDPHRGNMFDTLIPDCSLFCDIEFANIIDKRTSAVLSGKMTMNEI